MFNKQTYLYKKTGEKIMNRINENIKDGRNSYLITLIQFVQPGKLKKKVDSNK